MQSAVLPVIQELEGAALLQNRARPLPPLSGIFRQEPAVHHQTALTGQGLLGIQVLPPSVQGHRQFQCAHLDLQLPSRTVGILGQLQLLPVGQGVLGGNAAFQIHPAFFVQLQFQPGEAQRKFRLGIRAVLPGQLRILRKGQVKVPAVELTLPAAIAQVHHRASPEHQLLGQHLPIGHPGICPVTDQLLRHRRGIRQGQCLLLGKGLLPRLLPEPEGIGIFQQLHTLRQMLRPGHRDFHRHKGLAQQAQPCPNLNFPGRYGSGLHRSGEHPQADFPLGQLLRQLEAQLKGNPAVQTPLSAPVLRGVQHPDHHPAGDGQSIRGPLLAAQDGLAPGRQDSAHVRHSLGKLDFLGLLRVSYLAQNRLQAGAALILKCHFHFGSLLIPNREALIKSARAGNERFWHE